jgi:hypothetical protein
LPDFLNGILPASRAWAKSQVDNFKTLRASSLRTHRPVSVGSGLAGSALLGIDRISSFSLGTTNSSQYDRIPIRDRSTSGSAIQAYYSRIEI